MRSWREWEEETRADDYDSVGGTSIVGFTFSFSMVMMVVEV